MPWIADFVECLNQGILAVGLERNVEVDGGAGGRGTKTLPVGRDGVPRVHDTYVTPKCCRRRREVSEGHGRKDGENSEPVVAHDYRESPALRMARGPESPKYWNTGSKKKIYQKISGTLRACSQIVSRAFMEVEGES